MRTDHRSHRAPAAVLIGALVSVLAACSGGVPSPLPGRPDTEGAIRAAQRLATALSERDLSPLTFADQVTDADQRFGDLTEPIGADAELTATASEEPEVEQDRASDSIEMRWQLPGAEKAWTYRVTARFSRVDDRWQPQWSPGLVHPRLAGGGTLQYDRTPAERGRILGNGGTPLVRNLPVDRIGIDKTKVSGERAEDSARRLAELLDIDASDFVQRVRDAGDEAFVQAIVYRRSDPRRPSGRELSGIDGAFAVQEDAMLPPSKDFAAPVLGVIGEATEEIIDESEGEIGLGDEVGLTGLQARYDDRLRGRPDITLSVLPSSSGSADPTAPPTSGSAPPTPGASSSAEPVRVFHSPARDGEDLRLSMDRRLQTVAEQALADTGPASALVAVQPSTGKVLAAANGPGADGQNIATYGQYPPGSTFKIIDALALIRDGASPGDRLDCPATTTVDGRQFENYDGYPASALGPVDFRTAFANSCNTAFIGAYDRVSTRDMQRAAASLGLGTDYDVGYPAYFGSVPKPESSTERAATMIGQGRVLASPLVMASVVASVQSGQTVLPELVAGEGKEPKAEPLTEREAEQLRQLMGSVVSDGSGARLQQLAPPSVIAKTGTAEYGTASPPKTHAWMVAGQGDLAVAVFVAEGDSGSGVAGPLLQEFLERA